MLRELIERRVASTVVGDDATERLLANVEGAVSPAMRQLLAQPVQEAAVLLGLVERPAGWTVLLTERAGHLTHHPGQVSLPGGCLAGDHEDALGAALREAWEEVRLPAEDVRVVGALPRHITATGFAVTPVVGFVSGDFRPQPDPAEVAAVFEVPLAHVLEPGNIRETRRERLDTRFRVYELVYDGRLIWGATAAMLVTFRDLIIHGRT